MITADTITDAQIKALWKDCTNEITEATLMDALGLAYGPCMGKPSPDIIAIARARCAEILNARNKEH